MATNEGKKKEKGRETSPFCLSGSGRDEAGSVVMMEKLAGSPIWKGNHIWFSNSQVSCVLFLRPLFFFRCSSLPGSRLEGCFFVTFYPLFMPLTIPPLFFFTSPTIPFLKRRRFSSCLAATHSTSLLFPQGGFFAVFSYGLSFGTVVLFFFYQMGGGFSSLFLAF